MRTWWARVFEVGPHAGSHRAAVRSGVAIAVPLIVVWAIGRLDLLEYAAIGAFAALYGRHVTARIRLRMQAEVGAVLAIGVVGGTLLSSAPDRLWWLVLAVTVFAVVAVLAAETGRWQPPGALNPVFALTACATVPAPIDQVPAAAVAVVGSVVVALLVVVVTARWGAVQPATLPRRTLAEVWASSTERRHVWRYALAMPIAGLVVAVTGIGHPYWMFVTASVPMSAPGTSGRVVKAAQRVLGTAVGLGVAAVLLWLHPTGVVALGIIALLHFGTELTTMRNYSFGLVFFTPLALLLGNILLPAPTATLIGQRALETVIGLAIALAVTLATHERRSPTGVASPRAQPVA